MYDSTATNTVQSGGAVVEPWFGFNHKVGEKTDFNYSFSLYMMPNSLTFNNTFSFNLRVDFIIEQADCLTMLTQALFQE